MACCLSWRCGVTTNASLLPRILHRQMATFVDLLPVRATGGHGGDGGCSFHVEKYIAYGGPSGGNGGVGGDVVLIASKNIHHFGKVRTVLIGEKGQKGTNGRDGHQGKDMEVDLPIGTTVRCAESNEVIIDLVKHNQRFVLAEGGAGGKGNKFFKTATNQAPREFTGGIPGDHVRKYVFELRTLADVGLVGFPNAGKSTLLNSISAAQSKVAAYPFTTLTPFLGTITFEDYSQMFVADIPGLIEGAHLNKGLGHEFLRHVERSRVLCYIVDTAGVDGRLPWNDFRALKEELRLYKDGLDNRQCVVVANKMDLPEAVANLPKLRAELDCEIIPISAMNADNVQDVVNKLRSIIQALGPDDSGRDRQL